MTLHGHDIAAPNGATIISEAIAGASFCIVKSTEGLSYHDVLTATFAAALRKHGLLVGYYHYAWPEFDAVACADDFIAHSAAQPGEILCLDFEPYRSKAPAASWAAWIAAWATRVHDVTGAWPWLYANDYHLSILLSYATSTEAKVIRSMPLWKGGVNNAYVPSPSYSPGNLHGWPCLTAWQWSGTHLDADEFYGTPDTWHALGVPGAPPPPSNVLELGDFGVAVENLQKLLNHWTPATLTVDGVFGPATEAVVKQRQTQIGVTADGVWGPLSVAAEARAEQPASRGGGPRKPPVKKPPVKKPPVKKPPVKKPTPIPTGPAQLVVDGYLGKRTATALQWSLGVTQDGIIGEITRKALQKRVGVKQDGIIGPVTVKALQKYVGATQDGIWPSMVNDVVQPKAHSTTTEHVQTAINARKF